MPSFSKLLVVAAATSFAVAAPQLGGLPSLPVCLTGTLASSLPLGLDIISCAAGQSCQDPASLLAAVPILGSILGGIIDELPVGVGLCG